MVKLFDWRFSTFHFKLLSNFGLKMENWLKLLSYFLDSFSIWFSDCSSIYTNVYTDAQHEQREWQRKRVKKNIDVVYVLFKYGYYFGRFCHFEMVLDDFNLLFISSFTAFWIVSYIKMVWRMVFFSLSRVLKKYYGTHTHT